MPKFIDSHPVGSLTAEELRQLPQTAPKDKFGVTQHDKLYNKKEDRVYCALDAPNKEAVANHHKGAGLKVEWIHEVESTRRWFGQSKAEIANPSPQFSCRLTSQPTSSKSLIA